MQHTIDDKIFHGYPFLAYHYQYLLKEKPYTGLSVLHNTPLTLSTLPKIICLLAGGADVTVSSIDDLLPQPKAVQAINDLGIPFVDKSMVMDSVFDVHLDCCAELLRLPKPRIGAVELTQTGSERYKATLLNYPVISVDDCKIKQFETIGTGIAYVDALKQLTDHTLYDRKFMLFGLGKVGTGIVEALKLLTKNIVIVDKRFIRSNYPVYLIDEEDLIRKELKDTFCVVTATGVCGLISSHFDQFDFDGVILSNMGALDEFGWKFSTNRVLFKKRPINFSLEYPTPTKFLDPIFYAHNLSIDLLLTKQYNAGYHPFPEDLSNIINNDWVSFYKNSNTQVNLVVL